MTEEFTASVRKALEAIDLMLEADGYAMTIERAEPSRLTLAVTALDGACEDCLAPRVVFAGVVADALENCGIRLDASDIELRYPTD
jgi:hypothetical protein